MKERRTGNRAEQHGRDWQNNRNKKNDLARVSPEKKAEKMTKLLGLNDSQKADLQSLFEKQTVIREQQMQKVEKQREEMKSQFEAQRKTSDEALAKILGPDKFQKYQSMRTERTDNMKNKRDQHKQHMQKNKSVSN